MEDFQEEQLSSLLIICPDRSEYATLCMMTLTELRKMRKHTRR